MDVSSMVKAYLADRRVEIKNKDKLSFDTATRVFVDQRQNPAPSTPNTKSDDPDALTVEKVNARFADARLTYSRRKSEQQMARMASKTHGSPL